MGSRPDGWWRDRAEAARRLIAEIALLVLGHGGPWTIVFDGRAPPGAAPPQPNLIVIHTGHGRCDGADDRIVELVDTLADRSTSLVYTSDAELRARVGALGAQVAGARALLNEIAAVRSTIESGPTRRLFDRGEHRPDRALLPTSTAETGNRESS